MHFRIRCNREQAYQRPSVAFTEYKDAPAGREGIEQTESRAFKITSEGSKLEDAIYGNEAIKACVLHDSFPRAIGTNGVSNATSASTRASRHPSRG